MLPPAVVRPGTPADVPALQAIEVAAGRLFLATAHAWVAHDDPPPAERLLGAHLLVVAEVGGAPVGYAMAEVVDGHLHLEQISVDPDHGGRGVGTLLLDAVVDAARTRGDGEVTLTTFADVPFNRPLYERRGWEVVPPDRWGAGVAAVVATEAEHGLDPATRVVMRRATAG